MALAATLGGTAVCTGGKTQLLGRVVCWFLPDARPPLEAFLLLVHASGLCALHWPSEAASTVGSWAHSSDQLQPALGWVVKPPPVPVPPFQRWPVG